MASKKGSKTYKVGRSAKTGRFIKVTTAKRNPGTTVIETMKKRSGR